MKNIIKISIVVCIIVVLGLIIYLLLNLIPVYIYDSNTTGKVIEKIEDIELCKNLINKKYETILYGNPMELKKMYNGKYYDKINEFSNSKKYQALLDGFYMINVDKVYKKFYNVYILKYNICYLDNTEEQITTIIKFNHNKTRAIIIYDDMFEVKE